MLARERFQAIMHFQPFDRLPLLEWAGWWDETLARWYREGLNPALQDRFEISRQFGLDTYKQCWVPIHKPGFPSPASHGAPLIDSIESYEALRPLLYPSPAIDRALFKQWAREQAAGDTVIWITLDGFFWFPRTLLGIEQHLFAFYTQPELMHRICTDLAAWHLQVLDELHAVCTPDFMTFAEDMSYNHGSMLSQDLFDTFMKPHYQQVIPVLNQMGTLPLIDSDGDITVPAHWFADAGLQGILPLERQAGVDIARLRAAHPRMRFIGHFDKMTMHRGEAAMRAEFERLLPTAAAGGFLISCDHQTPPGVSLQDYHLYLALFREYAAEAGRRSRLLPQTV